MSVLLSFLGYSSSFVSITSFGMLELRMENSGGVINRFCHFVHAGYTAAAEVVCIIAGVAAKDHCSWCATLSSW